MNNSNILIFGDICPTDDTREAFLSGSGAKLFGEMFPMMQQASYCIANLECALTDSPEPVKKCGPVLFGATVCAKTIADAGINALSIANNHIRDCGNAGVLSTIEACRSAGIDTFGAGCNSHDAALEHRFRVAGKNIAVISFCEREFNYTHDGLYGGKAFDVFDDFDRIRDLKPQVDYLIVIFHGGIEHHQYPTPLLQKKCRKMVQCGADLVLCQHSHCVGSFENFLNGYILYGQGNSIFGFRKGNILWNQGLVVSIDVASDFKVDLIPVETKHLPGTGTLNLCRAVNSSILTDLYDRSQYIDDEAFVQNEWRKFCDRQETDYLPLLWGWSVSLVRINRVLRNSLAKVFVRKLPRNVCHNLIRCDAHREVLNTILSKYDF